MLNPTAPDFRPASSTATTAMAETSGLDEARQIRAILHWQEHSRERDRNPPVDVNALLAGEFTNINSTHTAITALENELRNTVAQRTELEKLQLSCLKVLVPDPEIRVIRHRDAVLLAGYSPMLRVLAYKEDLARLREKGQETMSELEETLKAEGLL